MLDQETGALWSHILGACMKGTLKDVELESLPADMLTWRAWKAGHPETTVLNLRRTSRNYTRDFYRNPDRFVVGFIGKHASRHVTFTKLMTSPQLNVNAGGLPLLILSDRKSTSVRIFDRRVGRRTLTFHASDGQLRDKATQSLWDRKTGQAIAGPLRHTVLTPHVGIVSFSSAWKTFHPGSQAVK